MLIVEVKFGQGNVVSLGLVEWWRDEAGELPFE